ncbi:transmembrane protein 71 [Gouania willdenowi]|uniref:Transmembrane protein 71 n=1 Tax=Gouania willdenowi TaxID=441366 RepID=A0A8C5H4I8_GOUWI|nr:transmembrane protein 71 [Gouania willdenowi]
MALFFSGATTSSPIKRRLRSNHGCQSLDTSLLSPDSSYMCYTASESGDPCCCRRSPRLLTNGYYAVADDSFSWDHDGNVSLSPCKTKVSYKENLVRVFRRRRRPRSSLVGLLSDVTESCQSWLDEKVFGGVFGTAQRHKQDQDQDQDEDLDQSRDMDMNWKRSSAVLDETSWNPMNSTELEDSRTFTYDPTDFPHPADKMLLQEEITSDLCPSQQQFSQSEGGLSEVPPLSPSYTNSCCCQASHEHTGWTMKAVLLLTFIVFILTAVYSGCLWWSATAASTVFGTIATLMLLTKSGPMGDWRKAKTEDITSGNE